MNKSPIIKFLLGLFLICLSNAGFSQTTPTDSLPGDPSIAVYTVQHLKFGGFYQSASGGTITVRNDGTRTATGTVVPLGLGILFCQAIFDVEAPAGTVISIMNGPAVTLTGSNGGTMSLQLGLSDPVSPFNNVTQPPARTSVNIGGTLTVGSPAVSKPGTYSGTFYITFNQQ
jgi:hypothetical protein